MARMQSASISTVFQFIRAVVRHWGSLVSGGAIIGFLGIWQGTGHRVPPTVFWIVAIVGIFVACYLAWNEERIAKEKALAAIAELELTEAREATARAEASLHTSERDWSTEWKELTVRFEKLPKHTEAQLQTDRMHGQITSEEWRVSGYAESMHTCEALCRYAGTLLLKSPHFSSKLSVRIRNEQNPAWRWFFFLKESCNAADIKDTIASLTNEQGYSFKSEVIREIPVVSARACIDCASLELIPEGAQ
jgi:hypothetical protein